ncbi:MAG: LysR substrate-binding domain-containing protein, partial [Bacteroidota bacterium]
MNLQQLEYIVAVDIHRHFARAAESCHVTQPTLSMMIRKLEDELDTLIFDRSRQPVMPTEAGTEIIEQARIILQETERLREITRVHKGIINGELRVGIIPTLAPYLLPLFINPFLDKYPSIRLRVAEYTTETLLEKLRTGELDVGILVTPLEVNFVREIPLFYEAFMVYASHQYKKEYLMVEDINPDELWLLEEGHCFRSQIMNLCELRRQRNVHMEYAAGSIETLKQLVEKRMGVTILPELATLSLSSEQQLRLKPFQPPAPVREVSLVTHRNYIKARMVEALKEE